MITRRVALIDNDALVNLTHVFGILNLLRNIFQRLEIPTEIKNEYEKNVGKEPQRVSILKQLRPNQGFWSLCTELDKLSEIFLFNFQGIDKGESELICQGEKKGIRIIISDDKKFKKVIHELNKNFLIVNSLFVIASLDINGFLTNQKSSLSELYIQRPFKSKDLREAYQLALKEYGLNWTNKKISERTSLKKLGIA